MPADILESLKPTILVIFGINGDLSRRKLLPAIYQLVKQDLLPETFCIVGVTRNEMSNKELLEGMQQTMAESGKKCDPHMLQKLSDMIEMVAMDLLDPAQYAQLRERLNGIENDRGVCMNRLFYLAIPAQIFEPVVAQLGKNDLSKSCQHGTGASRLLVEKPFGYDLASAHELLNVLGEHYSEEQIYRIDHYLAKETAQNILNFRFQNPIFARNWDNKSIKHIMITAAESIGIEGRVAFYEQTGALRDLIQSHLLQLLALVTMEKPKTLTSADVHHQKLELLKSITPIAPNMVEANAVRGQYDTYRAEVENADSLSETYAAIRLEIDNPRWEGVPILLRTGKALAEKVVDIAVVFSDEDDLTQENVLTIRIQPNEGIALQLLVKKPGFTNEVEPVQMDFCYRNSFSGQSAHPDAYERVIIDAFRGDKTLFATSFEVIASWEIIESVIHEWAKNDTGLEIYKTGSWGPKAADTLAEKAGMAWVMPDMQVCQTHTHATK